MKIYTELTMDATGEAIWSVLMDFKRYPTWNPLIREIEGEPKPGQSLSFKMDLPPLIGLTFKPTLLEHTPLKRLAWLGQAVSKNLFSGKHYFECETLPDGKTLFKHYEIFSGFLAKPIFILLRNKLELQFEKMNAALAEQVTSKN